MHSKFHAARPTFLNFHRHWAMTPHTPLNFQTYDQNTNELLNISALLWDNFYIVSNVSYSLGGCMSCDFTVVVLCYIDLLLN